MLLQSKPAAWFVAFLAAGVCSIASAQGTVTKVIDSGPDGEKLNIAVLGEGYSSTEQQQFNDDVNRLLVQGVFARDFFSTHISAFNVYRVNLVSNNSGVSQRTY